VTSLHSCMYSTVLYNSTCILCMRILHSPPRSMYVTFQRNWTFEMEIIPSPEPGMGSMIYVLFGKKRFENREKKSKSRRDLRISQVGNLIFTVDTVLWVEYWLCQSLRPSWGVLCHLYWLARYDKVHRMGLDYTLLNSRFGRAHRLQPCMYERYVSCSLFYCLL
jgi:hypothetical protein